MTWIFYSKEKAERTWTWTPSDFTMFVFTLGRCAVDLELRNASVEACVDLERNVENQKIIRISAGRTRTSLGQMTWREPAFGLLYMQQSVRKPRIEYRFSSRYIELTVDLKKRNHQNKEREISRTQAQLTQLQRAHLRWSTWPDSSSTAWKSSKTVIKDVWARQI